MVMKNPSELFIRLKDKHGYKLKGVGDPEYHLGGNFGRDSDGTLYWGAKTYIEKSLRAYERIFGSMPSKKTSSPIDMDDHPELDDSSLLEEPDIKIYQSLIGSLQWAITLGRFDISVSVMVMSHFVLHLRLGI